MLCGIGADNGPLRTIVVRCASAFVIPPNGAAEAIYITNGVAAVAIVATRRPISPKTVSGVGFALEPPVITKRIRLCSTKPIPFNVAAVSISYLAHGFAAVKPLATGSVARFPAVVSRVRARIGIAAKC